MNPKVKKLIGGLVSAAITAVIAIVLYNFNEVPALVTSIISIVVFAMAQVGINLDFTK